jgi:hypothetical protein
VCALVTVPLGSVVACSDDSEGMPHALEGTWEGHLFPYGGLTIQIDRNGDITEIAFAIDAVRVPDFTDGMVDDGPDTYTMTWNHAQLGPIAFPFLTDQGNAHAAMALLLGPLATIGAFERAGSQSTVFFESDVVGSWTGYGYAYEQSALDFVPFSPVTADVTSGTPIGFTVTMPSGTVTGTLPNFGNLLAFWGGTAVTGADVWGVMSPDKQFVAVEVAPSNYENLEDLTIFALNRDP